MFLLRQEHGQAALDRHLVVPGLQEDGCWWCLAGGVSVSFGRRPVLTADRTPAAAATRSTIRRLREIAEV
jgi:hypothetical protein